MSTRRDFIIGMSVPMVLGAGAAIAISSHKSASTIEAKVSIEHTPHWTYYDARVTMPDGRSYGSGGALHFNEYEIETHHNMIISMEEAIYRTMQDKYSEPVLDEAMRKLFKASIDSYLE